MVYACNPSTQDAKAQVLPCVLDQPGVTQQDPIKKKKTKQKMVSKGGFAPILISKLKDGWFGT